MFGFEFQELQRQLVEKLHSLGISLSGLNEFRYKYGRVTSLVALVVVVPILRRRLLLLFKKKSHPRSPGSEGASEIGKNHVGNNSVENSNVGKVKMDGDSFAKGMNAIKSNGSRLTGEVMKKLPEVVPFSVFLKLVEKGKVDKAVLSRDTVSFSTTDVLDALKELGEDYSDIISSRSSSSVSSSAEGNNLQEESVVLMTRPVTIFPELVKMLHSKGVMFDQASPSQWSGLGTVLVMSVPFIYLAIVGAMFYKFYDTGSGGDVGKLNPDGSNAPPADPNSKKGGPTKFADVAGIDDAKAIVAEVSDMLKNPGKYDEVGARLPSGIMLVGPPGTGKTMLARAIANEAGLPFFYCSGSDFVEVYAGRGAARVRKLFERAAKAAPSLVFFDEIDALGKSRSAHELSSNEEREQTLNQLLAAMDGFSSQKNVVVMAATNRFDILDKALVRPGRFDRVVRVNKPDKKGREAILRVHTKQLTLGESVEFEQLAELTLGFTGAELAMLVNEAAIHLAGSSTSSSAGRKQLEQDDFIYALDSFLEARGQKPIWNGNNTSAGSNFGTESLNSFLRFSSSSSSSSSSSTPPALEAALDMMNNGNAGGRGRGRGSSNLNQQQQQQQQQGQQQGQWPRQTHRPHFPNGDNPMSNGHAPGLGELD